MITRVTNFQANNSMDTRSKTSFGLALKNKRTLTPSTEYNALLEGLLHTKSKKPNGVLNGIKKIIATIADNGQKIITIENHGRKPAITFTDSYNHAVYHRTPNSIVKKKGLRPFASKRIVESCDKPNVSTKVIQTVFNTLFDAVNSSKS